MNNLEYERYLRARECCVLEHLQAAVEEDNEDKYFNMITTMEGGEVPEAIPYDKDPFYESMDVLGDPTDEQIERILNAESDMTYEEMVGIS